MKKIITGTILLTALYSTAYAGFFDNTNLTPWSTNVGNSKVEDNGIFDFNPYSFIEPRFYIREADNFMNKIDKKGSKHYSVHNFPAHYEKGNQTSYN